MENFIFSAVNLWYFVLRYELPYKIYVRIDLGTCVRFSLGNCVIKPCKWEQKDMQSLRNDYVIIMSL